MITILEQRVSRLEERKNELANKANSSEDIKEMRGLLEQVNEVNEEIKETRAEIEKIKEENRNKIPEDAKLVNGKTIASFKEEREKNPLSSMEYRQAFMNYVQSAVDVPMEQRAGEVITTTDNGVAIPMTIMDVVINKVRKRYGNLYEKVTKTNMKGGIAYPIGSLKAKFKWVSEGTVSPKQKFDKMAKVQFAYHTAEIRIAQSFLSAIVSLDAFEAKIAEVIVIAYLQAMDEAIVNGTGDGMPTGILNDQNVLATGNVVEMTATELSDWTAWRKKFFAKLPLGYRYGEFIFPLSTVESYLETMADSNNNPIFRQATGLEVNDGDAMNPNGTFFGRGISLVEPDILPDFDTASSGDVVGIFWQPEEYALNENFGFTMRKYFDEETNEVVDKALIVVDGKVLNPQGFFLIKKK